MSVHALDDSALLTRYLLGQATEEEMATIEGRMFEDDEFFARIEVAADDLAARFVGGTLSPDEQSRFRTHVAASADDRLRLRVGRALAAHAGQVRHAPARWRTFAPMLATAASLVMLAGIGVLSWRVTRLQSELSTVRASLTDTEAAASGAGEREQVERRRREDAERRLSALTTVSFVVTSGTERGEQTPRVVPKDMAFAHVELALDRSFPARCRVTVKDASRATIWSQDVGVSPSDASIAITVPAALLATGQYEIVVESLGAGATVTEEAVYGFPVARR